MATGPRYQQQTVEQSLPAARIGARSTPADFGAAVGDALAQGGNVAGNFAIQQQRATADAEAAKTMSQARLDWNQRMNDLQNQAGPGAPGFTQSFESQFDAYANTALEQAASPQARKFLQDRMTELRTSLGVQANNFENRAKTEYQFQTIKDAGQNVQRLVYSDPSQFVEALGEHFGMVDAMPNLTAEAKAKYKSNFQDEVSLSAETGEMQRDPVGYMERRGLMALRGRNAVAGPRVKIDPANLTADQKTLVDAANAQGVDPGLMLMMSGYETGGTYSSTAKNPASSAYGYLQVLNKTWKQYGGTDADRSDPTRQATIGASIIRDNISSLTQALGRAPTPAEVYMAHQQGAGAAVAALKADPGTPMADVLKPFYTSQSDLDSAINNNGLSGKTVGQALAMYGDKLGKYTPAGTPMTDAPGPDEIRPRADAPISWNVLPWEKQSALYKQAQTLTEQKVATDRQRLSGVLSDATASLTTTGQWNGYTPKLGELQVAFGVADGTRRYEQLQNAQRTGQSIQSYMSMPTAQIVADVNANQPLPGDGFIDASRLYQARQEAAQRIMQARAADPGAFVLQSSGDVRNALQAVQAATTPQARAAAAQDYALKSVAEQQRLGIETPAVLPKSMATQLVSAFNAGAKDGAGASNLVKQQADQWGKYWPDVFKQIHKDLPPSAQVLGYLGNDVDPATSAEIVRTSTLKPDELKSGLQNTDVTAAGKALQSQFAPFGKTMSYSLGGQKTYATLYDTAERLTYSYMQRGMAPDDAAKQAYQNLVGKTYQLDDTARVPSKYDLGAVRRGRDSIMGSLDTLPVVVPPAPKGMKLEDARTAYLSNLKRNAIWVTGADDNSLVLFDPTSQTPVMLAGNQPVTRSFDELVKAGGPSFIQRTFGTKPAPPVANPFELPYAEIPAHLTPGM